LIWELFIQQIIKKFPRLAKSKPEMGDQKYNDTAPFCR